ncbi:glycosyltransferase [Litoribaculum gwangyangense]|uniref:Glycosyltransferase n=1 Tax=Litoribaculum gwangyangense TaxID=1130722 RepID=A0ABP9CPF1_9FLAO
MRVLQLIDSLQTGGSERVAVNLANALSVAIEYSALCTTREEGVLKKSISKKVGYLYLNKNGTLDVKAIKKLNAFVKKNKIQIIHAHSTSFFLATTVKIINSRIKIVWHDHYGNSEFLNERKFAILKICSKYFSHIFCVNKILETWASQKLKFKNTLYLPNFATLNKYLPETNLHGANGKRIICLANLRPQKDHITLIQAFKEVHNMYPDWTLHCVGKNFNDDYSKSVENKILELDLEKSVFLYGSKPDIHNILSQCDIGVLSSKSEGLPIALLEYGLSNLAVIATKVGECEEVVSHNKNGLLVNASSYSELAKAITLFIENENIRVTLAKRYHKHVKQNYSEKAQIETIIRTYETYVKKN